MKNAIVEPETACCAVWTPSKKTSVLDCLLISYALCSGHMLLKVVCVESAKQGRFEQRHCQSLSISAIKFLDCLLVSYPDDLLCSGQTLLQIVLQNIQIPRAPKRLVVHYVYKDTNFTTSAFSGPPNWDQQGLTLGTSPTKLGPAGGHPGHFSHQNEKCLFLCTEAKTKEFPWRSLYQIV